MLVTSCFVFQKHVLLIGFDDVVACVYTLTPCPASMDSRTCPLDLRPWSLIRFACLVGIEDVNLSSCANFCLIGPTLLPVVVVLKRWNPFPEVIRMNMRFAPDPFCCCFLYPLVNTSSRMPPFQVHRRVNLQDKQLLIFTHKKKQKLERL